MLTSTWTVGYVFVTTADMDEMDSHLPELLASATPGTETPLVSSALGSSSAEDDSIGLSSQASASELLPTPNSIVTLNVGGVLYDTTVLTLTKNPNTVLGKMFSGQFQAKRDKDGNYFIDSDGKLFRYVLRYLQCGILPPDDQAVGVYQIADYFCIEELKKNLEMLPTISLKQIQEGFFSSNNHLDKVDTHVHQILQKAKEISRTTFPATYKLNIFISIRRAQTHVFRGDDHACFTSYNSPMGWPVDVIIGPDGVNVDPAVYVILLRDWMVHLGYRVPPPNVNYPPENTECECGGRVFRLILEWLL